MSIKVFNLLPKINETRYVSWHETCARKCRIVVNAGVNVKNSFIKVGVMMALFGILARVNANVINRVMLVNTWIMLIVNAKKG